MNGGLFCFQNTVMQLLFNLLPGIILQEHVSPNDTEVIRLLSELALEYSNGKLLPRANNVNLAIFREKLTVLYPLDFPAEENGTPLTFFLRIMNMLPISVQAFFSFAEGKITSNTNHCGLKKSSIEHCINLYVDPHCPGQSVQSLLSASTLKKSGVEWTCTLCNTAGSEDLTTIESSIAGRPPILCISLNRVDRVDFDRATRTAPMTAVQILALVPVSIDTVIHVSPNDGVFYKLVGTIDHQSGPHFTNTMWDENGRVYHLNNDQVCISSESDALAIQQKAVMVFYKRSVLTADVNPSILVISTDMATNRFCLNPVFNEDDSEVVEVLPLEILASMEEDMNSASGFMHLSIPMDTAEDVATSEGGEQKAAPAAYDSESDCPAAMEL